MDIIPVMDLLQGVVVRGVAGHRDCYQPLRSSLVPSTDPSVILHAFRNSFAPNYCYVADLDAIQFQQLNRSTIAALAQGDTALIVDRGVRGADDVEELLELGVAQVVVALETLPSPAMAALLLRQFGAERLILSLDLRQGRLMSACSEWQTESPLFVARQLFDAGFLNFIVLDVSAVGTQLGPSTLPLCRALRATLPEVRLVTGGGIRGVGDLRSLQAGGVDAALIASALHDERLTVDDLRPFCDG